MLNLLEILQKMEYSMNTNYIQNFPFSASCFASSSCDRTRTDTPNIPCGVFFGLHISCAARKILLGASWVLGMLIPVCIFSQIDASFPSLMRRAVVGQVSIVSLLASILLPYLLSAFAVYISKPLLLLPIAFIRGFTLILVLMTVSEAFGSAGWLIRGLFLFSDVAFMPFLYLFWHRNISVVSNNSGWVCCGAAVLIGCLDYYYISPFLLGLLS